MQKEIEEEDNRKIGLVINSNIKRANLSEEYAGN